MDSLFKISVYLFLSLVISLGVKAGYSDVYDKDLSTLSVTDPRLTIKTAKQQLQQETLQADFNRQLVLYFYLAKSYSLLLNLTDASLAISTGMEIAKQQNHTQFISEFMGLESLILAYNGQLRLAGKKANLALQFARETGDYRLIASMLSIRAQTHLAIENYALALKDTKSALAIFKEYKDRENLNDNYNLLAMIYGSLGEYDKAIEYYDVSISYDDSGSLFNQAIMYYNKGTIYAYKNDNERAIENLNLAKELSIKLKDYATLAYVRYSLAELYYQDENLIRAEKLAMYALDWFATSEDIFMHLNTNLLLFEISIKNANFIQAKKYLGEVDSQSESMNTPRIQLSVLRAKTEYFAKQELWSEAYELGQESLKVRSELYKKDTESSIEELKLKYDTQYDQEKMDSLLKQNQLQQEVIGQEKNKQQYFLGLIALTILILIGLYYAYRNQRSIKSKLYLLTIKDDLTQIANRRYILELLSQLHEKSLVKNQLYTVVMVDLDKFKSINDKYGHFKGNEVLIQFANVAKYTLPDSCQVGRLGGEEWLLLLPNHDRQQTELLLSKLRKNYNNPQLVKLPIEAQLHFSCGVKTCQGDCLNVEHTLVTVDAAMYEAKSKGRNQDVYC